MTLTPYLTKKKLSIKTQLPKTHIVWHGSYSRTEHTPYGSKPAKTTTVISQWENSNEKRGAPYLIGRDGDTYQLFDDSEWTYHLNIPTTNGHYDKQSVPIMLANELHLIREDGQFYAFDYPHTTNRYLGPVIKHEWNNYQYWAALTESQIDAAIDVSLLTAKKHGITPVFYAGKDWNPEVWKKATIFPHSAVKKGVSDFPPFAPWVLAKIKDKGITIVD